MHDCSYFVPLLILLPIKVASVDEATQTTFRSVAAPRGPVPMQLGGFECVNKTAYGVRKCNSTELVERAGTVCSKCVVSAESVCYICASGSISACFPLKVLTIP